MPVALSQNRINYPRPHRSGVIVGQNRRYSPWMTHNDESGPAEWNAKRGKAPQPGRNFRALTRMARDQAPAGRLAAPGFSGPGGPLAPAMAEPFDPVAAALRRAGWPPPKRRATN